MTPYLRWHVVYTAPNAEALASKAISDLGFQVFTPFEKRLRRLPNRKPQIYGAAYFPRYGFVRFDMEENKWPSILKAKGVLDILRNNAKPLSITDRIIDALKVADRIGLFDKTRPPSVGMSVEVTAGPFSGLLGRIMRARTGDRMDVLLRMFGAEVSATIPVMALREMAK